MDSTSHARFAGPRFVGGREAAAHNQIAEFRVTSPTPYPSRIRTSCTHVCQLKRARQLNSPGDHFRDWRWAIRSQGVAARRLIWCADSALEHIDRAIQTAGNKCTKALRCCRWILVSLVLRILWLLLFRMGQDRKQRDRAPTQFKLCTNRREECRHQPKRTLGRIHPN